VYIPKDTGKETRPIGIPTLEDKVLQRAVVMLLEPIYEQAFLLCSYGFRPKRSAHQALAALWRLIMNMCGCWLIDADISKFFDTLDKGHLREIVSHRVRDGVIRRLIGKWLSAGVMEEGVLWHPVRGTPQGGVISPLLSNIYLHEVLDQWFEREVRPLMRGRAFLIRFADDFVMGFEMESDARRVMEVLPKRFGRFGLTIHPEKTRLIDFRSPERSGAAPVSFDFLGFTHHWGRSRKGQPAVKRRTRKARFARGLKSLGRWCRAHRHDSLLDQSQALARKLAGHYAYYGIIGNWDSLSAFRHQAVRTWHKWLARRTNPHKLPWNKFNHILDRFQLPQPHIVHSV
jgi:group II intron reverse transcriptase/maturase